MKKTIWWAITIIPATIVMVLGFMWGGITEWLDDGAEYWEKFRWWMRE